MVRGMTEQATMAALFDELTSAKLQRFPAKGVKLDALVHCIQLVAFSFGNGTTRIKLLALPVLSRRSLSAVISFSTLAIAVVSRSTAVALISLEPLSLSISSRAILRMIVAWKSAMLLIVFRCGMR